MISVNLLRSFNRTKRGVRITMLALTLVPMLAFSACSSKNKGGAGSGVDGDGYGLAESDLDRQYENRYGSGSIPTAEGSGMFKDVHFNYDSASLDGIAQRNVEYNAQVLEQNPNVKIQLEGHCDERGTAEYNLALGSRRAQSVMDQLLSLGVPRSRIETISYGEEVPLDPRPSEDAYSQNRRVHFSGFENEGRAQLRQDY